MEDKLYFKTLSLSEAPVIAKTCECDKRHTPQYGRDSKLHYELHPQIIGSYR